MPVIPGLLKPWCPTLAISQGRATIVPINLYRGCPLVDVLGMHLHKIGRGWGGVELYRDTPKAGMLKHLHHCEMDRTQVSWLTQEFTPYG